ncbi:glycosyltransferase family 2 protein, partial [Prevotella denticola]|uniref:glycosyltransferase family 2 protein n=1 Tax=Prevotella denticola TaxID=28129 RepID=UPI00241E3B24
MPKISVLVAVYNTAEYLPQCLDSLLNQTLKDVEVVCVDDASTDDSLDILHQYAARDTRLKVIALDENRGQAHARNIGLSCATGDYIGFVDSDDWLGP